METYIVGEGGDMIPFCPIHWDASRMDKHDRCTECLEDAHELEILSRGVTR